MLYMLSAGTAGLAGVMHAWRFSGGAADAGDALMMLSIAAVFIGGVSMSGGQGRVVGTVIGALILAVLQTGLIMTNVETFYQYVVVGIIVILAVLMDQAARSDRRASGSGVGRMEPLLSVKNLVKRFGGLTAVNHVSLDMFPGEVIGLVGDNGAGKSTLIKMISGVYHPTEGEIYFEGKPVHIANPAQARDMGIETIYQDLALAGNLPMSANIFLGRERKKRYLGGLVRVLDEKFMLEESEKLLETLDVHIPSVQAKIDKLSGGQRQAVAIVRALYWNARLLIMDEPTNNLGVAQQSQVIDADPPPERAAGADYRDQPHHARYFRGQRSGGGAASRAQSS